MPDVHMLALSVPESAADCLRHGGLVIVGCCCAHLSQENDMICHLQIAKFGNLPQSASFFEL